jgi:hypothetical protein
MSTLATVEQVMRETKIPMSVRDIVDLAGDLLPTRSKTPDTVVARDLSMDLKRLGEESRFVRTAPGRYTLREFLINGSVKMGDAGTRPLALRHQKSSVQPAMASEVDEQHEATPVLASALREGRHGVMSAQSSSQDESGRGREQVSEAAPAQS